MAQIMGANWNPENQTKHCPRCGEILPAPRFYRDRGNKTHGLQSYCKACAAAYRAGWEAAHPDYTAQRRLARVTGQLRRAARNARARVLYWQNHWQAIDYQNRYTQANRETINDRRKARELERLAEQEHGREIAAAWRSANPDKVIAALENRRAREAGWPDQWTAAQWHEAQTYWGGRCAVCGKAPNGKGRILAADHWIPLTDPRPDNPGTVAWNMVCLCHGVGGCNNRKGNRPALAWLVSVYGELDGAWKYRAIEDYLLTMRRRYLTASPRRSWFIRLIEFLRENLTPGGLKK